MIFVFIADEISLEIGVTCSASHRQPSIKWLLATKQIPVIFVDGLSFHTNKYRKDAMHGIHF
jgi:hypothetical protein